MNLSLLILLPLLTAVAILLVRKLALVKWIALIGSAAQLFLAFALLIIYRNEIAAGNTPAMLFEQTYYWFPAWHINFHIGVDGISVAMILLTAFVVIAGVLVS